MTFDSSKLPTAFTGEGPVQQAPPLPTGGTPFPFMQPQNGNVTLNIPSIQTIQQASTLPEIMRPGAPPLNGIAGRTCNRRIERKPYEGQRCGKPVPRAHAVDLCTPCMRTAVERSLKGDVVTLMDGTHPDIASRLNRGINVVAEVQSTPQASMRATPAPSTPSPQPMISASPVAEIPKQPTKDMKHEPRLPPDLPSNLVITAPKTNPTVVLPAALDAPPPSKAEKEEAEVQEVQEQQASRIVVSARAIENGDGVDPSAMTKEDRACYDEIERLYNAYESYSLRAKYPIDSLGDTWPDRHTNLVEGINRIGTTKFVQHQVVNAAKMVEHIAPMIDNRFDLTGLPEDIHGDRELMDALAMMSEHHSDVIRSYVPIHYQVLAMIATKCSTAQARNIAKKSAASRTSGASHNTFNSKY